MDIILTHHLSKPQLNKYYSDFVDWHKQYLTNASSRFFIDLKSKSWIDTIFHCRNPVMFFLAIEIKTLLFYSTQITKQLLPIGEDPQLLDSNTKIRFIYDLIETAKNRNHGHYAFPCFFLAKIFKLPPAKIASILANNHHQSLSHKKFQWIAYCLGVNGFFNISVSNQTLKKWTINWWLYKQSYIYNNPSSPVNSRTINAFSKLLAKASDLDPTIIDDYLSSKQIIIEYSQPNTHKNLHIGHLRNICLGQSISNLKSALGYDLKQINYIGDQGIHIAKCLWMIDKLNHRYLLNLNSSIDLSQISKSIIDQEKKHQLNGFVDSDFDNYLKKNLTPNHVINTDNTDQFTFDFSKVFNSYYILAEKYLQSQKDHPELLKLKSQLSKILLELEQKTGKFHRLWKLSSNHCLFEFKQIYRYLNVKFDHYYFESELTELSQDLVDHYYHKNIFIKSQGAIGVDLSDQNLGFMLLRKSDGNSLYISKDLALAIKKNQDYPEAVQSLYVVGDEQKHHFKQLFACLKLINFNTQNTLKHLSYGMVTLKQGKMSSRQGNSVSFDDLNKMISSSIENHLNKSFDNNFLKNYQQTLTQLTIGTMKYGMLSQDKNQKLTFDPDLWCKFEGQTGPYLMYAFSRACSLLIKASKTQIKISAKSMDKLFEFSHHDHQNINNVNNNDKDKNNNPPSDLEIQLILAILNFQSCQLKSANLDEPAVLCNYLYGLTKIFSRFYTQCPILSLTTINNLEALCHYRLIIVELFKDTLNCGLKLLGIDSPSSM